MGIYIEREEDEDAQGYRCVVLALTSPDREQIISVRLQPTDAFEMIQRLSDRAAEITPYRPRDLDDELRELLGPE